MTYNKHYEQLLHEASVPDVLLQFGFGLERFPTDLALVFVGCLCHTIVLLLHKHQSMGTCDRLTHSRSRGDFTTAENLNPANHSGLVRPEYRHSLQFSPRGYFHTHDNCGI